MPGLRPLATITALLALAAPLASSPGTARASASAQDAGALIDNAVPGDIALLEAALPTIGDPAQAALLRAAIAAARLDRDTADQALDIWFAAGDMDPRRGAIARNLRATVAYAAGDYPRAADALAHLLALPGVAEGPGAAQRTAQALELVQLLAQAPRQAVLTARPATVRTVRDRAGLIRTAVTVGDRRRMAVLDTGANLSVISARTARALHLRMLGGRASVGSSSATTLPTRVGIAGRVSIAGVTLSNVVFLVLDERELSFPLPGGYQIDMIIGFPVLRALGTLRFDRAGTLAVGAAAGSAGNEDNLRASGNDLYVLGKVNDIATPLHLDTGATHATLSSRFAARNQSMLVGLPRSRRDFTGAGGTRISQPAVQLKPVVLTLGGQSLALPALTVATHPAKGQEEARGLGLIGQNVLRAFDSYTIDFTSMHFALGPPHP